MLLIIFGICIIATIICIIMIKVSYGEGWEYGAASSIVIGAITLLFIIMSTNICVSDRQIDRKIEMYTTENNNIENEIQEVVENYQKYEKEIFTEVSPESAITLVSLYPDLKSDELVKQQIDIYVHNNTKIKDLKEERFDNNVWKWWLYFGGY